MSALEKEALGAETTTFEHFDREWTVPTKRHLSHLRQMREHMREGVGTWDMMIAEVFLSPEEYDALCELDPDEKQLDEFTQKIANAMGLGNSGNSQPSSASS